MRILLFFILVFFSCSLIIAEQENPPLIFTLQQLEKNQSHCDDVKALIGEPLLISKDSQGIEFEYFQKKTALMRTWIVYRQHGAERKQLGTEAVDSQSEKIIISFDSECLYQDFLVFTSFTKPFFFQP